MKLIKFEFGDGTYELINLKTYTQKEQTMFL